MFTDSGMGMAAGVGLCLAAVFMMLAARKLQKHRVYGYTAAGAAFLLGAALLLNRAEIALAAAVLAFGQALGFFLRLTVGEK